MTRGKAGRRAAIAVAVACGGALFAAPGAGAATTLRDVGDSARWSGSISNAATVDPSACAVSTCRSYALKLQPARDAWDRPGGLLVSLAWPDEQLDFGYDLDLYVYGPGGALAAWSNSVIYSSDEGAWVQDPERGTYRVVVVPRDVLAGRSPFDVNASLKRGFTVAGTSTLLGVPETSSPTALPYHPDFALMGRKPAETKRMLPDLVPAVVDNFRMETTAAVNFYQAMDRDLDHPPSCYPQETTGADAVGDETPQSNAPLRCLRFDQTLVNGGRGPYEMRAYPNNGDGTTAYQAVYRSDGSYSLRKVGRAYFSNAHGHIHFEDFDDTGLYKIRPDGSPGKLVEQMTDKGRCALDTENPGFGTRIDGPSHYVVPGTCDTNDNQDPNDPLYPDGSYLRSGISPGWSDTYPWFIPDQYIDVTNVPDGRYLIVDTINSGGRVVESDASNNVSIACVEFHGTTANACPDVSR